MTAVDHAAWADWVVRTCLLFGCSAETAHLVAVEFVRALKRDRGEA